MDPFPWLKIFVANSAGGVERKTNDYDAGLEGSLSVLDLES